jgi:hypothetical protein
VLRVVIVKGDCFSVFSQASTKNYATPA